MYKNTMLTAWKMTDLTMTTTEITGYDIGRPDFEGPNAGCTLTDNRSGVDIDGPQLTTP